MQLGDDFRVLEFERYALLYSTSEAIDRECRNERELSGLGSFRRRNLSASSNGERATRLEDDHNPEDVDEEVGDDCQVELKSKISLAGTRGVRKTHREQELDVDDARRIWLAGDVSRR